MVPLHGGRRRAAVALGLLSLGIVGAIGWVAGHRRGVVPASLAAPVPALAATTVATLGASEARTVRCSLDSTPQEANVVRVDTGAVVGKTPVTIALPQADAAVTFRFEKAAYHSATLKVIPDLDKALRIDLVAEPEPAAAPAPEPRASVSSSRRALARQGGSRKKAKNSAHQVRSATPVNPFDM